MMADNEVFVPIFLILAFLFVVGMIVHNFWRGWYAWRYHKFPYSLGYRLILDIPFLFGGRKAAKRRRFWPCSSHIAYRLGLLTMIIMVVAFLGMMGLLMLIIFTLL